MLHRNWVFVLAALGSVVSVPAHPQFQAPTPEELNMTRHAEFPDADAIGLYYEETLNDHTRMKSIYSRIKVLTEKGKEYATVTLPYLRGAQTISGLQGRTIHSDGKIIPFTEGPSDLVSFQAKKIQVKTLAFTLPDVDVGSILEYRITMVGPKGYHSEPSWQAQKKYPILKARFTFQPHVGKDVILTDRQGNFQVLNYTSRIPKKFAVVHNTIRDFYSVDLTDVPALPKEDWMAPLNSIGWRVDFFYTDGIDSRAFWAHACEDWDEALKEFLHVEGVRQIAYSLIAPTDSAEQIARKLYAAVQQLDNTDFSRTKSRTERKKVKLKEIRNAVDVWKQRSGTRNEIALLYAALAGAAGLNVFPAQVVDRDVAILDQGYHTIDQLDDVLVIVAINGKEYFLDPGEKMCPFGALHWKHGFAGGFRTTAGNPELFTTPLANFLGSTAERIANINVHADGSIKGTVRVVLTGSEALEWRQRALQNDLEELKKQFNEALADDLPDGVHSESQHFLGLDDPSSNLIVQVSVTGTLGTTTSKRLLIPELFFDARAKHPFTAQQRTTPIDIHFPRIEQDDVSYTLPPGYALEATPAPARAAWGNRALFQVNPEVGSERVEIVRKLIYNFAVLGLSEYDDLRAFSQKVAAYDEQQLVFARTPGSPAH